MNSINLIPAHRLAGRRRGARVRVWLGIAPVCISLLGGSYAYLFSTWETSTTDLCQQRDAADARSTNAEQSARKLRASLRETQDLFQAAQAVGKQPDWGLLLSIIADMLEDNTVLDSVTLESADPTQTQSASKPAPTARPGHYRLTLSGFGRTQEAASSLALRCTKSGLFDSATLIESRRASFYRADAFAFRIECAITDAPPEGRAP